MRCGSSPDLALTVDESAVGVIPKRTDPDDQIQAEAAPLLQQFYELAGVDSSPTLIEEDLPLFRQLRQDGYTPADIEYAIKWTARNIPAVKRFSLVKLSIVEAFADKWSV